MRFRRRQLRDVAGDGDEIVEILLVYFAAADAVGGDAGFLGQQTGGELFGTHFQGEDRDRLARHGVRVVAPGVGEQRLGGAEGDLGGERGFAHAGAAGEDNEVGGMQAAHFFVQVAQAGIQAGDRTLILMRGGGDVDCCNQGFFKRDQPAFGAASGGEVEQGLFGRLDLGGAVQLRLGAEGAVDRDLADINQLAADPGVVDGAAVIAGVDDADHGAEELGEVGGAADLFQHAAMFEFGAKHYRVGDLAGFAAARDGLEDAAVDGIGEMFGREKFGNPLVGLVVGKQGAEQGLLGFDVAWRQALGEPQEGRIDRVHPLTLRLIRVINPSAGISGPGEKRFIRPGKSRGIKMYNAGKPLGFRFAPRGCNGFEIKRRRGS